MQHFGFLHGFAHNAVADDVVVVVDNIIIIVIIWCMVSIRYDDIARVVGALIIGWRWCDQRMGGRCANRLGRYDWYALAADVRQHLHIRHREYTFARANATLEPIVVDAACQHHQFALVQRQLDGRLREEIEFGARLTLGRLLGRDTNAVPRDNLSRPEWTRDEWSEMTDANE